MDKWYKSLVDVFLRLPKYQDTSIPAAEMAAWVTDMVGSMPHATLRTVDLETFPSAK